MLNNRVLQALLAFFPVVVSIMFVVAVFVFLTSSLNEKAILGENQELIYGGGFILLIVLLSLMSLFSLVYYIIHAIKNPNLKEGNG